jgi:hypothetical protein
MRARSIKLNSTLSTESKSKHIYLLSNYYKSGFKLQGTINGISSATKAPVNYFYPLLLFMNLSYTFFVSFNCFNVAKSSVF